MADLQSPEIIKPIPSLVTNEGSVCGPMDLKEYVRSPNAESGIIKFYAELTDGRSLPEGLMCTVDGLLGGISGQGTAGTYNAYIIAENESDEPLVIEMAMTINPKVAADDPLFLTNLKSQVWEALGQNLPIPEMDSLLNRPISAVEIYYLLQRFAVLTIWDVYNLEPAGEKTLLSNLEGANPHYNIYDRGSCLLAAPKDLFSHQRTLGDALQAAKVMAREVYKRGWTIEFAGFNKMVRAAWIELQLLGDKNGKQLEILHYTPSAADINLYTAESKAKGPTPG